MITLPVININGTAARELLEQHCLAMEALRAAISTVQAAEPNGRDYQTTTPATYYRARAEHVSRLTRLEAVLKELDEIARHVSKAT
jgi:hypothetical protein